MVSYPQVSPPKHCCTSPVHTCQSPSHSWSDQPKNISRKNKPLVFRPTQTCASIYEKLHVLVLKDYHLAINITFKKQKVKCNVNEFIICSFCATWYLTYSQLWSLSSRQFGNFFYVVIRCMLVVLKYLQSNIKLCKIRFQTSITYFI